MQTNVSASLLLRLTDKISVQEIHIDVTVKVPNATLNFIEEIQEAFCEQTMRTNELRQQLQSVGIFEFHMQKETMILNSGELEAQTLVRLTKPVLSAIK